MKALVGSFCEARRKQQKAPSLNIGNIGITIGGRWSEWQLRSSVRVAAVGVENGCDGAAGAGAGVYLLQP